MKLDDVSITVDVHRIKRIFRKLGLRCKPKQNFKATTDVRHFPQVAPNLFEQNFEVSMPNLVLVSDITCLQTEEGWAYLAGIKNLCAGEIVDV